MTTTPNDANAESAAKLVSELSITHKVMSRNPTMLGEAALDAIQKAIEWIERHATTQTQATHGDGEAEKPVAWCDPLAIDPRRMADLAKDGFGTSAVLFATKPEGEMCVPLYTHAAPSPTAAQNDKDERAYLQIIDERDAAQEALSQAYYLVTGRSPDWSSVWGINECLEEIDDAQQLLRKAVPSPTAAPALGGGKDKPSEFYSMAFALDKRGDDLSKYAATLLRQAAALSGVAVGECTCPQFGCRIHTFQPLSGVAAQGDGAKRYELNKFANDLVTPTFFVEGIGYMVRVEDFDKICTDRTIRAVQGDGGELAKALNTRLNELRGMGYIESPHFTVFDIELMEQAAALAATKDKI